MATNNDPTDLTRQEHDAEGEELKVRENRRKELDDLRWLLGHPQGRRIAMRLLDEAGVYRTSFNHSGSVMAFNEGKRHIGLFLTSEFIEASSEGFMKILKEYGKTKDE